MICVKHFVYLVFVTLEFAHMYVRAEETRCYSRFDYEEKLLERVIRTDIKMQQIENKIETAMETIKAHRREFKEIKAEIKETVKHKLLATNTQLETLEQQIGNLQDALKAPRIAFNVRGAIDTSPAAGQILVFKTTILNIGNAFDNQTGIFISPVSGTFMFSVQVCSVFRQHASFRLVTDDVTILSISNYNYISGLTSTSGSAAYTLSVGQKVWVQNEYDAGSSANLEDSDKERACWNQFSGVLTGLGFD